MDDSLQITIVAIIGMLIMGSVPFILAILK